MSKLAKAIVTRALGALGYEIRRAGAYHVIMNGQQVTRFLYFKRLFDVVREIDGDIVECGVGHGSSLLMLAFLVKEEMKGRKVWGFDSFEGFPEPSEHDQSPRDPKAGELGGASVYAVLDLLIRSGLDREFVESQVTLIKGYFDESLPKYRGSSISLLRLDVDLHDSYAVALRELYPKVARGGIVMFDEYMGTTEHLHFPGAQKAIDEYFEPKKCRMQRDRVTGKYYVIKE